jgi:hypothetical protein
VVKDVLFGFRSIDPTLEKEVMTKAGEETLEKIAQVRIILSVYLWGKQLCSVLSIQSCGTAGLL